MHDLEVCVWVRNVKSVCVFVGSVRLPAFPPGVDGGSHDGDLLRFLGRDGLYIPY